MEFTLEFIIEHIKWVFSGIGVPFAIYWLVEKRQTKMKIDEYNNKIITKEIKKSSCAFPEETYSEIVGKRHRWLRENILKLSLREMAKFYDLKEVSKIESFENGNVEFPLNLIEKLEEFFFISPHFIDGNKSYIFQSFQLSQASISTLFDKGFKPVITCCPDDREDLFCFIIMYKEENGFVRITTSNLIGSFASSGGGRMNIQYLINELIERKISEYSVPVLMATKNDWERLENDCYYESKILYGVNITDRKCSDIFREWYYEKKHQREVENGYINSTNVVV